MHQSISTNLDARLGFWATQTTLPHIETTPGDLQMRIDRPESEPLCFAPSTAPCTLQTIEPSALISPVFSMQRPYLQSKNFPLLPSPYVPASYRLPEVRSRSAALQCTLPVRFDHLLPLSRSTALSARNPDASTSMISSQQDDMHQRVVSMPAGSFYGDRIIVHPSLSPQTVREKPDMDHDHSTGNSPSPLDTIGHNSMVKKNSKRGPQACL